MLGFRIRSLFSELFTNNLSTDEKITSTRKDKEINQEKIFR